MLKLILGILIVLSIALIPILDPKYQSLTDPALKSDVKELDNVKYQPKNLSLNEIFKSDQELVNTLSSNKVRVLIATGDVIPARSVNYQSLTRNNFRWPFEKTADFLKSGDITFVNLETPLLKICNTTQEGMIFCGSFKHIDGLKLAGVDIVSLANNHAGNYGKNGVDETVQLLNDNGILTTGIDEPIFKNVKGLVFAFLGYNDITKNQPGVSNVDEEKIKKQVGEAKLKADVVVVTFHWGSEYQSQPDQRQIDLGHLTIDSGADLVIGNHPHWIQPVEVYRGKLITYAHGNFIFDQMWSEETKYGVVGKYTFYDKSLVDVDFFPVYIKDFGQPYFLEGNKKEKVLENLKIQSEFLSKRVNL